MKTYKCIYSLANFSAEKIHYILGTQWTAGSVHVHTIAEFSLPTKVGDTDVFSI